MEVLQEERFKALASLFEEAMALVRQQRDALFPTARELAAQGDTFRPAFQEHFRDGLEAYLHPEETDNAGTITAALSLYLCDEDPPETVRRALVRLLRDGGGYREALLYAASFLEPNAWRSLFIGGFPLTDSGGFTRIDHLTMPGADAKSVLAALLFHLQNCDDRKTRLTVSAACADALDSGGIPFCQAFSLWLTALLADEGRISDEAVGNCFSRLSQCVDEKDWKAVANEFFRLYADSETQPESPAHDPLPDLFVWHKREQTFNSAYTGRERHGWAVYEESSSECFLWCPGNMLVYPLSQDNAFTMDLRLSRDLFPQVCFEMDECARLRSLIVRRFQSRLSVFDGLNRLKWLSNFQDNAESVRLCNLMERCLKGHSDSRAQRKRMYRQFLDYTEKPDHNYETAKNLIAELEHKIAEERFADSDEQYLTGIFQYYLKKDDFFSLDILLRKYRFRGFHTLYEQASISLSDRLKSQPGLRLEHDASLGKRVGEWGSDKLRGMDIFPLFRCRRELDTLSEQFEFGSNEKSIALAEDMERKADDIPTKVAISYNFAQKASLYFKAAALRSRQPPEEGERAKELTVKAFYWLAGAQRADANAEISRDYYLFFLYLKDDLPAHYIDEPLNEMTQTAETCYFNPTDAYSEKTPIAAFRFMVEKESWNKALTALLHLILCVPSVLKEDSLCREIFMDEEIQSRFTQFLAAIGQSLSPDAEFPDALRDWRGNAVKMYNAFASELCDHALCAPKNRLPQMEERIRQIHTSFNQLIASPIMQILQIRNYEDEVRLRQFQRILEDTIPLLATRNYKLISRHTEICRKYLERMENAPPLYAFLLTRYPLLLIIQYMELYAVRLRGELRPNIRAEALFAETIVPGQLRIYLRILCDNDYSAVNVHARVQTDEQRQAVCKYVAKDRNGYGFVDAPSPDSPKEGDVLRLDVKLHFLSAETGEPLIKDFTLTPIFRSRQRHVDYVQVYNSKRALDGSKREDQCTFTGRTDIISRICTRFRNDPGSIILLYGQKRVGKSSISNYVLNQLRQDRELLVAEPQNVQLNLKNRNENLSNQDQTETVVRDFYRMALYGIETAFTGKENQHRIACMQEEIQIIREKKQALEENALDTQSCLQIFSDGIQAVYRGFEREPQWRGTHILLCYDEFQNYYTKILLHILQPEFLDFIKAFQESKTKISLLLVGSELMIPFIAHGSGNAFSIIQEEPVWYLEKDDAKTLISNSIPRMMGERVPNPFQYVEEEIFRLSAGNPLYIQLLCENLTEMLNKEKRVFASMDMIYKLLKSEVIGEKYFENLNNPDDYGIKFASKEDNQRVLQQIAVRQGMRAEGRNVGSSLPELEQDLEGNTSAEVRRIVEELRKRKVILKDTEENYRIAVPLYEAWIWEKRAEVGYFPVTESTDV